MQVKICLATLVLASMGNFKFTVLMRVPFRLTYFSLCDSRKLSLFKRS